MSLTWLVLTAAISLLPFAASAQEFGWSASVGATHSDNIGRSSSDERSDTSAEAGLQMNLRREQGRLTANVAADLQYRNYLDDTFDDELVGGFNGLAVFAILPERLTWTLQDNFGQSFIDPQATETPDNRQDLNYLTTGPDFIIPLGARTNLNLQGRWSQVSYGDSELDSQRYLGAVALVRLLGTGSVSLNASTQRVEFDQSPPNSDFDSQSYFVGYTAEGARTTLNLQAGYSAFHDFGETSDGALLTIGLVRRLSPRASLHVDAGTTMADSADAFRRDQGIGGVSAGGRPAVASADPYQQDYVTAALVLDSERSNLRFAGEWRKDSHEQQVNLDRERVAASVSYVRRLRPTLSLSLNGSYGTEDFQDSGVSFDEWSAGAGLEWQLGRHYSLSLRGDHFNGTGDTSVGAGQRDYDENRISLHIVFSPRR